MILLQTESVVDSAGKQQEAGRDRRYKEVQHLAPRVRATNALVVFVAAAPHTTSR